MNTDDFLAHHGIKGMRWGVRNAPGEGGRAPTNTTSANTLSKREQKAIEVLSNSNSLLDISRAKTTLLKNKDFKQKHDNLGVAVRDNVNANFAYYEKRINNALEISKNFKDPKLEVDIDHKGRITVYPKNEQDFLDTAIMNRADAMFQQIDKKLDASMIDTPESKACEVAYSNLQKSIKDLTDFGIPENVVKMRFLRYDVNTKAGS